ncbi:hypothetical protein GOBAR_DD20767 [Gossypium barbadense]|nr:hypothetical protein GOBAR_DD20767 [Gossypium barbadense]
MAAGTIVGVVAPPTRRPQHSITFQLHLSEPPIPRKMKAFIYGSSLHWDNRHPPPSQSLAGSGMTPPTKATEPTVEKMKTLDRNKTHTPNLSPKCTSKEFEILIEPLDSSNANYPK